MGEDIQKALNTLKPIVLYAIWSGVAVAVIAGVTGAIWLAQRREVEPPPLESFRSEQVDAAVPRLPVPDLSFNGKGVAVLTGGVGRDVAVDPQGRIVVLGGAKVDGVPRIVVWRLTPAGRLDATFGTEGAALVASTFPPGQSNTIELGQALALDARGRIVIAGYAQDPQGWMRVTVWRLTATGAPDREFHGIGRVVFGGRTEPGPDYTAKAVAIDAQERIVVAGSSRPLAVDGQMLQESLAVWRLTDRGELDTAFHGTGILTVPDTRGNALALDSAGRILVAGATLGPRGGWSLAVWRFLPDGSADTAWNGGTVLTPPAVGEALPTAASDLAVTPDGKVLVLGILYDPQHLSDQDNNGIQLAGVWRYLADGTPDPEFLPAAGGVAVMSGSAGGRGPKMGDFGQALALDARGRIAIAGLSRDRQGRGLLVVWRRTATGAADRTWGADGVRVQGSPPPGKEEQNAVASGIAADPQGRVLVTGVATDGKRPYVAVWRMKP